MRSYLRSAAVAAVLAAAFLSACGRHSSDSGSAPAVYSVELTGVAIKRPADGKDLPVTGLPAEGAKLTVY